jgi:outer membrane protein assembly factor BamB
MRQRLTNLLITCSILAGAFHVSAEERLTDWIQKIGRDTPHTMLAMATDKVRIAADKSNKNTMVAGPVDVRHPEELTIADSYVEYAGRKLTFKPWNKEMAGKPCVARWRFSGRKGMEIIIRANGRAAFLNGRPLQQIRHGFLSAPDGRVGVRLEQEKNSLVVVSQGKARPLISCICLAESLEGVCRERLQNLGLVSPETDQLWIDLLTHLAAEGADQLLAEGILLYMGRLDLRSPGSALIEKIRSAVPSEWGRQRRPTLVRKATWLETYKATMRSNPAVANLKPGETHYIGPFRPTEGDWFHHAFPPEKKVDLSAVIEQKWQVKEQTKTRQLKWKPKPKSWRDGRINDLRAVMKPPEHGVAYIYKTYTANRAGKVDISAGSDDGLMIWHNGKKVREAAVARGCAPDQELFSVKVPAGKQTFLIKITQGVFDWAFYFEPLTASPVYEFLAIFETMNAFPEQDHKILQVCEHLERIAKKERQEKLATAIAQIRHAHPMHKLTRISHILASMKKRELAATLLALRSRMPTPDIARVLMSGRDTHTLKQALEGIIAWDHDAFASELLKEIETANAAYWQTNSEALGEIYTDLGEYHARLGNFAVAHAALKKAQLLGTRVQHDKLIASVSVAENGERQLTVNPEIEQMFEETRLLIQENQPSKQACAKLYSFLRKYGHEGLKRPHGLQSAGTALQLELQSRPEHQAALTRYVAERLSPQIKAAIATNDMDRMETMLTDFAGLIDEAPLRRKLMRLYMDRGEFNAVHRHASQLLLDPKAQALAAAHLMAIVAFGQQPDECRRHIPPTLMDATVLWQGKKVTLRALQKELGLRDLTAPATSPGPGAQLACVQIPVQSDSYRELRHPALSRFRRQPLEPVPFGNHVLLGGPDCLLAFQPATGKVKWKQSAPFSNVGATQYSSPVRFTPFISAGQVWTLSGGSTPEYQLNAHGLHDGLQRWSSVRSTELTDWQVVTPPFGAGGWERVLLLTRNGDTTPTLALASFDAAQSRVTHVRPLHRVKDFVKRHYKPDLATVRFGATSTTDQQALFATTGCGSLMKIGLGDGRLAWLKTWRESQVDSASYNATAAGHVSVIGKQVVAYLPELLRWCGIDHNTGRLLWQHCGVYVPTQIHSRGSNGYVLFSTHDKDREPALVRLDPKTGRVLWSRHTNGLDIMGEGVTVGNRIWLPCDRSIAVYDAVNGAYLGIKPTPFSVHKIRVVDERWYLFSDSQLYIFAGQGDFAPKPPPTAVNAAAVTAAMPPPETDWRGLLLPVGQVRVPFKTFSGWDGEEHSKFSVHSLPDSSYSWLRTIIEHRPATPCALVREGVQTQHGVQPPQLVWCTTLSNPQLHGDRVLTYSPWELRVRNIYDLTDITRYCLPAPATTVNSDFPRILGAAWADDGKSISIQLSGNSVHVIAVPSGKRQIAFDVPRDLSRIDMAKGHVSLVKYGKRFAFAAKTGKLIWEIPCNALPDRAPYSVPGMFYGSRIHGGKKIGDLVDARTGKILHQGQGHWACTFRFCSDRLIVQHESAFKGPETKPMPGIKKCFVVEGGGALVFHDNGKLMWFDGKREQQLELNADTASQVKGYWARGHGGHGSPHGARFRDQIFFGLQGHQLLRWSTVDGRLLKNSQLLGKGPFLPFKHSLAVLDDGVLTFFSPQSAKGKTAEKARVGSR